MNKYKKSICGKLTFIYTPMILIIIAIAVCIINSSRCYTNSIRYYMNRYYTVSEFSAEFSKMNVELESYIRVPSEYNYDNLMEQYDVMCDALELVYDIRFEFDKSETEEIESYYKIITMHMSSDLKRLESKDDVIDEEALSSISSHISDVTIGVNKCISKTINRGNSTYYSHKITIYVSVTIMIVTLLGFVGLTAYVIYYTRKRIAEPLKEISEWAKQFEDGYTGMEDLEYDVDDEIGSIVNSFNIVKKNLASANQLKQDNEKALRKLHDEEANKMKFVKQLYNEKREKETISSEAKRDGLTGLYNRRSFDALIEEFVSNKPSDTEGALFLIDMDFFKNVNDTLGHLAGDEVLKTLAGTMRVVFPAGYLGRYGGDEFIAFVTGAASDEELERFGAELCKKMDREYASSGKKVKISVSVGIANTQGVDDYSELYMKADKALYHSKENGRNQYTLASRLPQ